MNVTMFMIAMLGLSTTMRTVLGREHPLVLVPLIVSCAAWFVDARGSWWQWIFLALGVAITGVAAWRTATRAHLLPRRPAP